MGQLLALAKIVLAKANIVIIYQDLWLKPKATESTKKIIKANKIKKKMF